MSQSNQIYTLNIILSSEHCSRIMKRSFLWNLLIKRMLRILSLEAKIIKISFRPLLQKDLIVHLLVWEVSQCGFENNFGNNQEIYKLSTNIIFSIFHFFIYEYTYFFSDIYRNYLKIKILLKYTRKSKIYEK